MITHQQLSGVARVADLDVWKNCGRSLEIADTEKR